MFYTLQVMRKLLPKNDYVRNRDRQDPIAVLKLSHKDLVDHIKKIGWCELFFFLDLDTRLWQSVL